MKNLIVLLLCLLPLFMIAQDVPKNIDRGIKNRNTHLSSQLLKVTQLTKSSIKKPIQLAKEQSILTREDDKIYVEVIRGSVTDVHKMIDAAGLEKLLNIQINHSYGNRASAWISPDRILEIANKLPADYHLEEVRVIDFDNEGPGKTNSSTYQGNSIGGEGIKIAIIDFGFDGLSEARAVGQAPQNYAIFNYVGSNNQIEVGGSHGRKCVETVYDHAPNAEYFLMNATSPTGFAAAIDDCIANGVNIISHSQSFYNTGWGDNSGLACQAVDRAHDAGILIFTSAGNRHGTHYESDFRDIDHDDWHNFSTIDEQNDFSISSGGTVFLSMQWNSSSSVDHYDLFLRERGTNALLASSTNSNGFESLLYQTDEQVDAYFTVRANTNNPPRFEVFNHDSRCTDFQFFSSRGSVTSPANSTRFNLISVGAVHQEDYDDPSGVSGLAMSYSSRGPTNGGRQAPTIVAPTETFVTTFENGALEYEDFGGTSCATPNAAGTAAAFWSAHPYLNEDGVRFILARKAALYKDWGSEGVDDIYGYGGLYLYDYHQRNRYIHYRAHNFASVNLYPYYSVARLDDNSHVPENRRLIYLDEMDRVGHGGTLLNKPMTLKSIGGTIIRSGEPQTLAQQRKEEPEILTAQYEPINFTNLEKGNNPIAKTNPFTLYPNPVVNIATLSYSLEEDSHVMIQILDTNGRTLKIIENQGKQVAGSHQLSLNTVGMESGTYFCHMQTKKENKVIKFVVSP